MNNKLFLCYALSDVSTAQKIVDSLATQGIKLELEIKEDSSAQLEDVIFPIIEDCDIFLVLASDISRKDTLVCDCVKYASDLNKTIVPIGFHQAGMFSGQSWIKKDWNIRIDEIPYLDEYSRAEFFAMMRAWLGMSVLPGDRIGEEISITVTATGQLYRNGQFLCALAPNSETKIRLKKGLHKMQVIGSQYGDKMILRYEKNITHNIGSSLWVIDIKDAEEKETIRLIEVEKAKIAELERKEKERIENLQQLSFQISDLKNKQSQAVQYYNSINGSFSKKDWSPNHALIIIVSILISLLTGFLSVFVFVGIGYWWSNKKHKDEENTRYNNWRYQVNSAKQKYDSITLALSNAEKEFNRLNSFSYTNQIQQIHGTNN